MSIRIIDYHLKCCIEEGFSKITSTGSTLVRGFLCSSTVDLNADFFVSIIRNQEIGCLLWRGVAGCIAGLFLRDAESFKGLSDLRMIVDQNQVHRRGAEIAEGFSLCGPIARGDWITTAMPTAIKSGELQWLSDCRRGTFTYGKGFLFGGFLPPNKTIASSALSASLR